MDRTQSSARERQLVVFELDGSEYGTAAHSVAEVLRLPEALLRAPRSPGLVEGRIEVRGQHVPLIDLRPRLGLPSVERSEEDRILVLELGLVRVACCVDNVSEVLRVSSGAIEPTATSYGGLLPEIATLRDRGRTIHVLNLDRLLSASERDALSVEEPARGE